MEARQIQCDNLGMRRDQAASMLGKDKSGMTNFAFENYNIRILANNDNTALSVTNEKSTRPELINSSAIKGFFVGGCKLDKFVVLFIKNPNDSLPDSIYRIHYDGSYLRKALLYRGNLNFDLNHPIEAVGYYESEEVQKVYWVDGYNPNRFINIADVLYAVGYDDVIELCEHDRTQDIVLSDGTLYALKRIDGPISTPKFYYPDIPGSIDVLDGTQVRRYVYPQSGTAPATTIAKVEELVQDRYGLYLTGNELYTNKLNPFDFQGSISKIPSVTIEKNYDEAGSFQAGVIQYFFTYYNKYGVETPIIWNSDLQYISMQDRGAKQDENVTCGFDFTIDTTTLDKDNYQYLRIYSCYRSSINVIASARLVTEISLVGLDTTTTPILRYSDLGTAGEMVNAADLKYLGGQNIIANTLDYKQDTMFFGDLKTPGTLTIPCEPQLASIEIDVFEDTTVAEPTKVTIQEAQGISWVYKCVSDHQPEGAYSYKSELLNSQEDIAGFKWREVYRFGIQFMTPTGEWTNPQWIGDKYCDLKPRNIAQIPMRVVRGNETVDIMGLEADGNIPAKIITDKVFPKDFSRTAVIRTRANINSSGTQVIYAGTNPKYQPAIPDANGKYTLLNYQGVTGDTVEVFYTKDGYYMATAVVDLTKMYKSTDLWKLQQSYVGYRLLMADMDASSRRIAEQGVINPTMFNYTDRYYNRPYSIPSWIFRPRMSSITNRHYDTLPVQTASNAELQGIVRRRMPAQNVDTSAGRYNAYILILAANDGGSYMKWKLIYYNVSHYNASFASTFTQRYGDGSYPSGMSAADIQQRALTNYAYILDKTQTSLESNSSFDMSAFFEDDYMVVSSGTLKYIATGKGSWAKLGGMFLSTLMNVVKGAKDADGNALPLIFSSAMLPDGDLLRKIAYAKGNAAYIATLVALCIATVAAVVATIFTAGGASPAIAAAAAGIAGITTVSTLQSTITAGLVSLLTGTSIAGMAGVSALAQNKDKFNNETDRLMLTRGFVPVNDNKDITPVGPSYRGATAYRINDLIKAYFTTETWDSRHKTYPGGEYGALIGDTDTPFYFKATDAVLQKGDGAIGLDYNAYVTGGILSFTTAEEDDLKNKNNLFCVDESIVTLNAPDIEDTANALDNSDAYDLQLVGTIPVQSAYGAYDLQCTRGLASASEVLRGRYVVPESVPTSNVLGLVNGDLYQDSDISETRLIPAKGTDEYNSHIFNKPVVTPNVALYRQWMWNRDTSIGMWMPGITLIDPLSQDMANPNYIQVAPAQSTHKLFANMRYSMNTRYSSPFSMKIYSPRTCLDDQTMLKSFMFNGETKFYYENVNTISLNNEAYGLVKNGVTYPAGEWEEGGETYIQTAALKDPVQIKFKETPHIVIPIQDNEGITNILPYTTEEEPVTPSSLYEDADKASFPGVRTAISGNKYKYLVTVNGDAREDVIKNMLGISNSSDITLINNSAPTNDTARKFISCFNLELYNNYHRIVSTSTDTFNSLVMHSFSSLCGKFSKKVDYIVNSNNVAIYKLQLLSRGGIVIRAQLVQVLTEYVSKHTYTGYDEYVIQVYPKKKSGYVNASGELTNDESIFEVNTNSVSVNRAPLSIHDGESKYLNAGQSLELTYPSNLENYFVDYLSTWDQTKLNWETDGYPYLFMGELVKKVFDYNTWMGGTDEYALEQLHWNVASPVTSTNKNILSSWGDTYYQRWDCEKTYPFTEEDKNSIVEVLSFMLESHKNLDGRSDINRGLANLLNLRPSNTMFNPAYEQEDNFFSYSILDDKFKKNIFETDIAWSLTKNNMSDVDSWTSLVAVNQMSLDGRFGTVRKILNVSDTLIAFQDSGMSVIKYNEETALQTSAGLPLQLGNTGKVTGYRILSDTIGCHNKFSINKNSAGVFFTDDYNKAFMQYTQNGGIKDIGQEASFSQWFKDNITGNIWTPNSRDAFRTSYDEVTHDLYIITNSSETTKGCLIYNTLLRNFTSFMSYIDTPMLTRINSKNGKSGAFAIRQADKKIEGWQLFVGNAYNRIYGNPVHYSMEYRINPDPTHDSIFTNYQFTADWMAPENKADKEHVFGTQTVWPAGRNPESTVERRYTTFDTVEAWNEYQYGKKQIFTDRVGRFPIKAKFRIWRGDIPRDGEAIGIKRFMPDRMRNPWIHLKFEKVVEESDNLATNNLTDDSKMLFHNLNVIYYNQYGRF